MKNVERFIRRFGGTIASLALIVGVASANAACIWWFHQPKVPNGMKTAKSKK
jgi:cyclic lactone autoinducer peptide